MPDLLAAALGYAEAGWPVFPCVPGRKVPLTAHGFQDATTDPVTVTAWWTRAPLANVAVATGAPGPDVLDVDTKAGRPGMELFDRARLAGLLRGACAVIRTPSGGLHLWFEGTDQPGGAVGGSSKPLELKARGGYVLLPPSFVRTEDYAGGYELVERRDAAGHIDFTAVRRLLDPPPPPRPPSRPHGKGIGSLAQWLRSRPEGNRNNAMFWAACRALESGQDDLGELLDAAVAVGLPEFEARRTVESARRRVRGAS